MTHSEIISILEYNPDSGDFTWKGNHKRVGMTAGWTNNVTGYRHIDIGVNKKRNRFLAHRLAWFYEHGIWPKNHIDHINGIQLDNRISNLREATRSENLCNSKISKINRAGVKGVYFHKARKHWVGRVYKNKKLEFFGRFKSKEEAKVATVAARKDLHGEFANNGLVTA